MFVGLLNAGNFALLGVGALLAALLGAAGRGTLGFFGVAVGRAFAGDLLARLVVVVEAGDLREAGDLVSLALAGDLERAGDLVSLALAGDLERAGDLDALRLLASVAGMLMIMREKRSESSRFYPQLWSCGALCSLPT